MTELLGILENQKEVKYLTYFACQDRLNIIKLKLGTCGVSKDYKFKDEDAALTKIIDILFELKKLEKWALSRMEKK